MRPLLPTVRAHALGAALFGTAVGTFSPWLERYPWALLTLTLAYVLVLNRWLAPPVPLPESLRPRKGSFKPDKRRGWKILSWTLRVTAVIMAVQVGVFTLAYAGARALARQVGL